MRNVPVIATRLGAPTLIDEFGVPGIFEIANNLLASKFTSVSLSTLPSKVSHYSNRLTPPPTSPREPKRNSPFRRVANVAVWSIALLASSVGRVPTNLSQTLTGDLHHAA